MGDKNQLANEIADYLFASGNGKEADRLLLVIEGRSCSAKVTEAQYLGGWSKAAVRDAIADMLARAAINSQKQAGGE